MVGSAVGPYAHSAGRRAPLNPAAEGVMGRGDGAAVARLGQDPAGGVVLEREVAVGVRGSGQPPPGIVGEPRDGFSRVLLDDVAENVVGEACGLAGAVGALDQPPGPV